MNTVDEVVELTQWVKELTVKARTCADADRAEVLQAKRILLARIAAARAKEGRG